MKNKILYHIIFLALIFLIGYGRFLPLPAPESLHLFFSRYGWIFTYLNILVLLAFAIVILIKQISRGVDQKGARVSLLAIGCLLLYFVLLFFIPIFKGLDHRLTIAVNAGRSADDFSNPVLGFRMRSGDQCERMTTYSRHPDDEHGVIISSGVEKGTLFQGAPCEELKYVSFASNEIGLTDTIDWLTYKPELLITSQSGNDSTNKSTCYDKNWCYSQYQAPLKLF